MALREVIARFDMQFKGLRQLKATDTGISGLIGKFQNALGVIAAFGAFRIGKRFYDDLVQVGDEIDKTSQRLLISRKELQQWRFAAGIAGVKTEELNRGMHIFSKNAYEASQGMKAQSEAFKALGVDVEGADGKFKGVNELFHETLDALRGVEGGVERAGLGARIFGRNASALLPLLNMSKDAVRDLLTEFDELGGGLSDLAIKGSADAADASARLDLAWLGLKSRIAVDLLPNIAEGITWFAKLVAQFAKAAQGTKLFQSMIIMVGGAIAAMVGKALLPLAPLIAKFMLLWLVVDDLLVLFQGGDSVIGGVIDKMFGKGTTQATIKNFIDGLGDLKTAWNLTVDDLERGFNSDFDDDLNGFFEEVGFTIRKGLEDWANEADTPLGWMSSAVGFVKEAFLTLPESIADGAGAVADALSSAYGAVTNWMSEMVSGIANGASDTVEKLKSFTGDFWNTAAELATAIVDGLIETVTEAADKIIEAVTKPIKDAFDAAKKIIEPGSPSRAMVRLAVTIPQGIAKGIDDQADLPMRAMNEVMAKTIAVTRNTQVKQTNNIAISHTGNPYLAAQLVGRQTGRFTQNALDDAYSALVPELS